MNEMSGIGTGGIGGGGSSEIIQCPVCGKRLPIGANLNNHVNRCLVE